MHWLLIVRRDQSCRTLVFAVPGMKKLMRQKIGFQIVNIVIAEHFFARSVVTGFVMFQAMVGSLVAQRKKKCVLGVMARAKELASFSHKLLQAGDVFIGNLDCFIAF